MFLFSIVMMLNVGLQSDSFGLHVIIIGSVLLGVAIYFLIRFIKSPDHFIQFDDKEIKYCLREHRKPVSLLKQNIANIEIELDQIRVPMMNGEVHLVNIIEVHDYEKRLQIKDNFKAAIAQPT
jgi:hypothetical protein